MSDVLQDDTAVAVVIDDDALIGVLIASHGDMALAAERASLSEQAIVERLPTLNREKLLEGIKTALAIQTFATFTTVKEVAMASLGDMTGQQVSKFMLELTDRLNSLVTPAAPAAGAGPTFNLFNQQMISEQASARDKLAERITVADVTPRPDGSDREFEPGGATPTPIRLGVHGEADAEGTVGVGDLVHPDGSWVGEDTNGSTNGSEED